MESMRICLCGRSDSQGNTPEDVGELWSQLEDVVERKLELAREAAFDPRVLPEMRSLTRDERELRAMIEASTFGAAG